MKVITRKLSEEIVAITSTISQTPEEGYARVDDRKFIIKESWYDISDVESVPEEVKNLPEKYCYNEEKGFYENPNWVEPEVVDPMQEYRDQLMSEVSEIGYNA